MSMSAKLRRAPMRAVTGAFILSSGVDKLSADEDTAKQLHGLASGTYGFVGKLDPKLFAKALAVGEITLGSALLLPVVSPVLAGAGLMGFSGALLNMYWNTPGMHQEGSPKPTQAGIAVSKDVWMFGAGAGLVADGLLAPAHDKHVALASTVHEKRSHKAKQSRKAKKAAKKARSQVKAHAMDVAKSTQADLTKRANKAAKKARKRAQKLAQKSDAAKAARKASAKAAKATKRIADARDQYGPVVVDKAKQARDAAKDARDQYGPVVVDKAKQARDAAQIAADKAQHAMR